MKERRRAPRFLALFDIRYESSGMVSFQSKCKAKNVSKIGVKIPVYKLIKPGTKLRLEIEVPGLDKPVTAHGRVVWTKKVPSGIPGLVDAGLKFIDVNTQDLNSMMEIVRKAEPA